MFSIICDKCKSIVLPDERATLESFLQEVDYIKDDLGEICDIAVNNYIIYKCQQCGTTYRYTLPEVEQKFREQIAHEVKIVRKRYVMKHDVPVGTVDPDNGLEFCGRCVGVDDEGNCFTDIIKQCSFRREK